MIPRSLARMHAAAALAVALSFACGAADRTAAAEAAGADRETSDALFLWKAVDGDDPGRTVHLLGSIHVGSPDFYPLDPALLEAFERSDALVVEVDISAVSPEEMHAKVAARSALPEGETLQGRLSPETWEKLVAALESYDVDPALVSRSKPWFAATMVASLRLAEEGFSPALGIDNHFIAEARSPEGIEILSLETVDFQLDLLDGMPPDLQDLFVLDAVEGVLEPGEVLDRIVEAWQSGDARALEDLLTSFLEECPEFGDLYQRIIIDRNEAMADEIERLLEERKRLFVVVGAGHLVGEEGLVRLFEDRGYSVEQVERRR